MNGIVSAVGSGEGIVVHRMNVNSATGAVMLVKLAQTFERAVVEHS